MLAFLLLLMKVLLLVLFFVVDDVAVADVAVVGADIVAVVLYILFVPLYCRFCCRMGSRETGLHKQNTHIGTRSNVHTRACAHAQTHTRQEQQSNN